MPAGWRLEHVSVCVCVDVRVDVRVRRLVYTAAGSQRKMALRKRVVRCLGASHE